jgi:hypothetical protein
VRIRLSPVPGTCPEDQLPPRQTGLDSPEHCVDPELPSASCAPFSVSRSRRPLIAQQVARARSSRSGHIIWVVQGALLERQAAASDARGQIVSESFEQRDLTVEPRPPGARQPRPVGCRRRSAFGQCGQSRLDLVQREPDPLRDSNKGNPPDGVPVELALAARASLGADKAVTLVEPEGGDTDARPVGDVPDGQQSRPCAHLPSFSHWVEPPYRFMCLTHAFGDGSRW